MGSLGWGGVGDDRQRRRKATKRRRPPKRLVAIVLVGLAVASLVTGIWVYAVHQPPGIDPVKLQWAANLTDKALDGIRPRSPQFRGTLDWDMRALIPGYGVGLLLACYLGWRVYLDVPVPVMGCPGNERDGAGGTGNLAQDLFLLKALSDGLRNRALLNWIEALSFAKFAALLVAGVVGIGAIMVTIGRLR